MYYDEEYIMDHKEGPYVLEVSTLDCHKYNGVPCVKDSLDGCQFDPGGAQSVCGNFSPFLGTIPR